MDIKLAAANQRHNIKNPYCAASSKKFHVLSPQIQEASANSSPKKAATRSGKNEPQRDLATGGGRPC